MFRYLLAALFALFTVIGAALAEVVPPDAAGRLLPEPLAKILGVVPAALPAPQPVSSAQAAYLVRSTLISLDDANRAGNYSVLRDLAGPQFQARHSAADLATLFERFRKSRTELSAALLLAPRFNQPLLPGPEGRLRLTGQLPTEPLKIAFDLTFEATGGHWRLYDLAVGLTERPPAPAQ